jgi:hypothetical protein
MLRMEMQRQRVAKMFMGMKSKFSRFASESHSTAFIGRVADARVARLPVMPLPRCAGQLHVGGEKVRDLAIPPCPAFHRIQHALYRRRVRSMSSVPHAIRIGLALIPYHKRDYKSDHDGHPEPFGRGFHSNEKVVHVLPTLTLHRLPGSLALASAAQILANLPFSNTSRRPVRNASATKMPRTEMLLLLSQIWFHNSQQLNIP